MSSGPTALSCNFEMASQSSSRENGLLYLCLQIIGFKFEVLVFSLISESLELFEDELFEKVWPRELPISGISVISVLCLGV